MLTEVVLAKNLPDSARRTLSEILRDAMRVPLDFRDCHTLPVREVTWNRYRRNLTQRVCDFQDLARNHPQGVDDFAAIRIWMVDLVEARTRIISVLYALRPFEYFDKSSAQLLALAVERFLGTLAASIDERHPVPEFPDYLTLPGTNWLSQDLQATSGDPLARTFGVGSDDCRNQDGEFSPSRVFSAYYLNNAELTKKLVIHMASLGMPPVTDPLVLIHIVGMVQSAADEIASYCALDALFGRLAAADSEVRDAALQHIKARDPALRQGRARVNRALTDITSRAHDREMTALRVAEAYKRLVEGPARQYGWIYHCLGTGEWKPPPMLSQLRDILISDEGWIARFAARAVLTDVRNGEAHEGLVWDGMNDSFTTESGSVSFEDVFEATIHVDAFDRGCAAAIACYNALSIIPGLGGPKLDDVGRLAAWRRVEALFGTNGLKVIKSDFNAKVATITFESVKIHQINPCLQALVAGHVLLPGVTHFEIYTPIASTPVISVSVSALSRTYPVWHLSLTSFTVNPLSTFLPANFSARRVAEDMSAAVRSISWIATDDLLDALDSTPAHWDASDLELFAKRVALVELAVNQSIEEIPVGARLRIEAVSKAVSELSATLAKVSVPTPRQRIDRIHAVDRLRTWWWVWGPIQRLPGVEPESDAPHGANHLPALRCLPTDLRWQTM